eukprot:4484740-Pleurochrysis_carterae.AAC.2
MRRSHKFFNHQVCRPLFAGRAQDRWHQRWSRRRWTDGTKGGAEDGDLADSLPRAFAWRVHGWQIMADRVTCGRQVRLAHKPLGSQNRDAVNHMCPPGSQGKRSGGPTNARRVVVASASEDGGLDVWI